MPRVSRSTFKGVEKAHVTAGTRPKVRVPSIWETILGGQSLVAAWGSGVGCLALSYFLYAQYEETFASSASGIHPVHCLARSGVTFYHDEGQVLVPLKWHRATRVEVRFRGHKMDRAQKGSEVIRVREVTHGPRSQIGTGGGAVAILVELTSCLITSPGKAPLCSYRRRGKV